MRDLQKNIYDFTTLFIRVTTGFLMFYLHGLGKITSGYERWEKLGRTITDLIGIDSLAIPLGFMASFSESIFAVSSYLDFIQELQAYFWDLLCWWLLVNIFFLKG